MNRQDADLLLRDLDVDALGAELARIASLPERINATPETVDQGLAKLVLGLIEFIRRVLERQAIRRVEGGDLTDDQIERLGLTLMRLEEKVADMATQFGLTEADLNLELGPLGRLL